MMAKLRQWAVLVFASVALAGCSGGGTDSSGPLVPVFHAETNPETLSGWKVLQVNDNRLRLGERVVPYDLNSSLFTDYAHKLRTVWMPAGTTASYGDSDSFEFPVGSVITKTFYYKLPEGASAQGSEVLRNADKTAELLNAGFDLGAVKLIETRMLVRREAGWVALAYVWNADQTDAVLKRTGDAKNLELVSDEHGRQPFVYVVPNTNQCAGCHATNATTRAVQPIGLKARHLNKDYVYARGPSNQLTSWQKLGLLKGLPEIAAVPQNARWDDASLPLDHRARSYLDINCSHCHNKRGPADTSGLMLDPETPIGQSLGVCKMPIAAGTGTGGHKFGIVPGKPQDSIFTYRMKSTNPSEQMPELGRSTAHDEGVALITQWIAQMRGSCG